MTIQNKLHIYLRDSSVYKNSDSYNSFRAFLKKLKLVDKLRSIYRIKKCCCLHEKQKTMVTNILFCTHFFFFLVEQISITEILHQIKEAFLA